jgi:hypothetical protein
MQCVLIPARARGATQNRTPRTRPEQLSGAAFPPRPPLLDSAFAGGGLNIRHERARALAPQPLQSLDVRLAGEVVDFPPPARFAADCPLVHLAALLPSAGALPSLLHRRSRARPR